MTPEQLLRECETMTHNNRMRRMVELGRLASQDQSIAETLHAFAQGTVYRRVLATQSCFGSRNTAQALQALSDPSRSVRALALDLVAVICSNAHLQIAFDTLPFKSKDVLLHCVYRRHRQTPIDTYLETLALRQDANLRKLLPLGSRAVVTSHLAQVIEQFDLTHWQRLARPHPSLAFELLHTRATSVAEFLDQQLIRQGNAVLPLLANSAPDLALELVRTLSTLVPLARLDLQAVMQKRPNEIANLVLQTEEQTPLRFDTVAHRLDTERLLTLVTRYPTIISSRGFQKFAPQQRLAVYNVCERGWRTAEGILSYEVVAALPKRLYA